jgi:hypothetical protein
MKSKKSLVLMFIGSYLLGFVLLRLVGTVGFSVLTSAVLALLISGWVTWRVSKGNTDNSRTK